MKGNNQFEKITKNDIIQRFEKIHQYKYCYDKVEYLSMHKPVCIICPEHGEFYQTPHNHLKGQNCPECAKTNTQTNNSLFNKEHFIKSAKEKFQNKFDYSKVNYINNRTKICIICPEHGEFVTTPYNHIKSDFGCKKCALKYSGKDTISKNFSLFVEKASKIHNGKYNYNKVVYNGSLHKIIITCPIHGDFIQNPHDHLQGCGCPKCNCGGISKLEKDLYNFLLTFVDGKIICNDRNIITPFEVDIFLPKNNIAIEFDGLYWHNENNKENNYHLEKLNKCQEQGIRLIHIFEDEWFYKQDIVKSRLKSIIGTIGNKLQARKCKIIEVNSSDAQTFFEYNHLQGRCKGRYHYGLYYNDELVSLMSFGKTRQQRKYNENYDDTWELLRFANKLDTTVIGGASKLLKHFIKEVHPKEIISYADKRWSNGNLYKKLGFEHTHDSKPNYFYVFGQHRENRFKFRKGELVKQGFDPNKSEHEIMLERKAYRIYDCGTMVFKMKIS